MTFKQAVEEIKKGNKVKHKLEAIND
jgi:hypothetical protein